MPSTIIELSAATWDALYREVIEDGDPVARADREYSHMLYSPKHGPMMVFLNVGFARGAAA